MATSSQRTTGQRKARQRRAPPDPSAALRRLPLTSLRVFVAVAEHRSFTRAASSLGVTVSAASMQIQAIERYLGQPLFERSGRQVELTTEAERLLPKIRDGLAGLQAALDDARLVHDTGVLQLSTLHSFLLQWLLPRLRDFHQRHPEVDLRMDASTRLVDFRQSGMHAGIRFGDGEWPGLQVERLLKDWLVPVCQPAMLGKLGPVRDAEDLQRYRLLHNRTEPWSAWQVQVPEDQWPERGVGFDDSTAIVHAAEAGAGLALSRWSLAGDAVLSGRLAIASPHITPLPRGYYFVCPPRSARLATVLKFRDWVREQAKAFPAPTARTAASGGAGGTR